MKLSEITSSMLAEAVEIYLGAAYRQGRPPEHVLEIAEVDRSAPLEAALARECVEKTKLPGRPGFIDKYRWRLGNDYYRHMKLGIERCSDADDFVFVVDTHDRDFPLGSPALQSAEFRELLQHNAAVKRSIETRWRLAGIPTFAGHITRRLRQQCAVGRGQPKTLLIVDDDEAILELEQALVEEAGYRVLTASGGLEALAQLERPETVDLCLLDIMMPSIDGLAVARRMRRERRLEFPIIYVTALPHRRVRDDIADDYVGKPFDPDHLLEVIRRHVE
jgi:CheY-like chemotaxis protein